MNDLYFSEADIIMKRICKWALNSSTAFFRVNMGSAFYEHTDRSFDKGSSFFIVFQALMCWDKDYVG